jgi:vitamin K-dependent gamma-carboxylase
VEARTSLNGRPNQLLIDPRIDLTTVTDGLATAAWILPAPIQRPPPSHVPS